MTCWSWKQSVGGSWSCQIFAGEMQIWWRKVERGEGLNAKKQWAVIRNCSRDGEQQTAINKLHQRWKIEDSLIGLGNIDSTTMNNPVPFNSFPSHRICGFQILTTMQNFQFSKYHYESGVVVSNPHCDTEIPVFESSLRYKNCGFRIITTIQELWSRIPTTIRSCGLESLSPWTFYAFRILSIAGILGYSNPHCDGESLLSRFHYGGKGSLGQIVQDIQDLTRIDNYCF